MSASSDAEYEPYRAVRAIADQLVRIGPAASAPVAVLTGPYGARVLGRCWPSWAAPDVRVVPVENRFFGGNVGVTGLLVGEDLARVAGGRAGGPPLPAARRVPDPGRVPRRHRPRDLPRPVEIVPTDGRALRAALGSEA